MGLGALEFKTIRRKTMSCAECWKEDTIVSTREKKNKVWRSRECNACGEKFETVEINVVDDNFIGSMSATVDLVTNELNTMKKLIKDQAAKR